MSYWWMNEFKNFKKRNPNKYRFINKQDTDFYNDLQYYLCYGEFWFQKPSKKRLIIIFYNLLEYFYNEYTNARTFYEKRKTQRLLQGLNNFKINNVFWLYSDSELDADSYLDLESKKYQRYGMYNLVREIVWDAKQLLDEETWEFITKKERETTVLGTDYTGRFVIIG